MNETTSTAKGILDADLYKDVLTKAARSYGQILGGAGLINGVLATSWAWAPRHIAMGITVVGVIGVLAGLMYWGRNNISTLRSLTNTSKGYLGGTLGVWLVGAIAGLVSKASWVWWAMALVLAVIGLWGARRAYDTADQIAAMELPEAHF
ncbi:MAG: hypothetical protein ACRDAX_01390 [Propionibacteriaceae bacterium]